MSKLYYLIGLNVERNLPDGQIETIEYNIPCFNKIGFIINFIVIILLAAMIFYIGYNLYPTYGTARLRHKKYKVKRILYDTFYYVTSIDSSNEITLSNHNINYSSRFSLPSLKQIKQDDIITIAHYKTNRGESRYIIVPDNIAKNMTVMKWGRITICLQGCIVLLGGMYLLLTNQL